MKTKTRFSNIQSISINESTNSAIRELVSKLNTSFLNPVFDRNFECIPKSDLILSQREIMIKDPESKILLVKPEIFGP